MRARNALATWLEHRLSDTRSLILDKYSAHLSLRSEALGLRCVIAARLPM